MLSPLSTWDRDATLRTFLDGTGAGVVDGVQVQKHAADLERYRAVVEHSGPGVIIETGTRAGGSALYFHRKLGLDVITIDVAANWVAVGGAPPYAGAGIDWVTGGSTEPDIVERVRRKVEGRRVMVSLDSDHLSPHVQAEIAVWGPLVTPGCYLVVEDACHEHWTYEQAPWVGFNYPEHGGPLHAMRHAPLLAELFDRDEEIEGMFPISHSPCGWWRRR